MKNQFLKWIKEMRLRLMGKWCKQYGLTVVVLVERAGSTYMRGRDGQLYKIGRKGQ